jgi:MFS-type transporter involved in bile tolerance (Atg22 family)
MVFSIPFLKNVEQTHYIERTGETSVSHIFRNIGRTASDIFRRRGLFLFVLAYFFYIDGVGTIISISTAYGTVLGLGTVGMILALLVTQIVAMPCSIWFANLAAKFTARRALIGAILIYTLICVVGFYMGFSLEPHQQAYEVALKAEYTEPLADLTDEQAIAFRDDLAKYFTDKDCQKKADEAIAKYTLPADGTELPEARKAEMDRVILTFTNFLGSRTAEIENFRKAVSFSTILFWAMAVLVGTVQGGIQAVSRSYFGKLIPKERSNEFFGFFDIFGKFASVLGPFLYALIAGWTGRSSFGVLALILLFLIGLIIMIRGKKDFEELESA